MAQGEVTRLLREARGGDHAAVDRIVGLMYDDLRGLARSQLRRQYQAQTLEPTALVHEAFLKLARGSRVEASARSSSVASSPA